MRQTTVDVESSEVKLQSLYCNWTVAIKTDTCMRQTVGAEPSEIRFQSLYCNWTVVKTGLLDCSYT